MKKLLFIAFVAASLTGIVGERIGYLRGKAEVADIVRGEPYAEDIDKELRVCGYKK